MSAHLYSYMVGDGVGSFIVILFLLDFFQISLLNNLACLDLTTV
jgi:hypothetical protein